MLWRRACLTNSALTLASGSTLSTPAGRPASAKVGTFGRWGMRFSAPITFDSSSTTTNATMTKSKRSGKVFLDWSQNAGSKTTISPYSLRGRERPWVATPVSWDEVGSGADDPLGLEQFRFDEVLARVDAMGDIFG